MMPSTPTLPTVEDRTTIPQGEDLHREGGNGTLPAPTNGELLRLAILHGVGTRDRPWSAETLVRIMTEQGLSLGTIIQNLRHLAFEAAGIITQIEQAEPKAQPTRRLYPTKIIDVISRLLSMRWSAARISV